MRIGQILLALVISAAFSLGGFELLPEAVIHKHPVSKSQWLWNVEQPPKDGTKSYFRLNIPLSERVVSAFLNIRYDDSGELFVNGKKIIPSHFAKTLTMGNNTIAVELQNGCGAAGVIFYGEIKLASGKTLAIHSDKNVKAVSAAPEGWNAPGFDDSKWPAAKEQGDVLAYPWARWHDFVQVFTSPAEKTQIAAEDALATTLPEGLKFEPEPETKIVYHGFMPKISVNGKNYEPVINLCGANNPYFDNIALKTGRLGIKIFQISIEDSVFYKAVGKYDFSRLDIQARRLLHLNPDALLLVNIYYFGMTEWCRKNPGECMEYAAGPVEPNSDERTRRPLRPSAASEKFKQEVQNNIRAFSEYVKHQPWGKRVIGIRVSYGIYSEWHTYGMYMAPDTGKAMTAAFRRYLQDKYKNDAALQTAWHAQDVTLNSAMVPTQTERTNQNGFLLDPQKNRKALDYYDCHANVMADLLLFMAKQVKENLPGRLCGAYYGYVFSSHPPEGANVLLDKVLSSPYIDFLSDPPPYTALSRRAGGDFTHRTVPATYWRYGKLSIIEDDSRFHHLYGPTESVACHNARESRMTMRRNYCNTIFDGCGIQLADAPSGLRPHAFDDPDVLAGLKESMDAVGKLDTGSTDSGNDTAVVVHYPERLRCDGAPQGTPLISALYASTLPHLNRSGTAFDLMTLYDFLASKQNYKTVLFLNAFSLSNAECIAVKEKIRRPGITAIWLIAPGSVTEKGFSNAAMSDLVGIRLAGAGITPNVHSIDSEARPLEYGAVEKTLPDKSRTIFIARPLSSGVQWQKILRTAGSHVYTAPGSYFRHHGNVFMLHTGIPGKHIISLPQKEDNKKVQELFSGQNFSSQEIRLTTDGPNTWLFQVKSEGR